VIRCRRLLRLRQKIDDIGDESYPQNTRCRHLASPSPIHIGWCNDVTYYMVTIRSLCCGARHCVTWKITYTSCTAVAVCLRITTDQNLVVFRPHHLHAVTRCGLLLQMSHVAWSVCLSVCTFPRASGTTVSCCAKRDEPIEIRFRRRLA